MVFKNHIHRIRINWNKILIAIEDIKPQLGQK